MKSILFLSLLGLISISQAAEKLNCTFPTKTDQIIIEKCAVKNKKGILQIQKSAMSKIKFDNGLASGSITGQGCFWLNKAGFSRKSVCFDNGADGFQYDLARFIETDGKIGFMNNKLITKIPAQFTFAFPFEYDYAKVCMNCKEQKNKDSEYSQMIGGKWMVIDKKGKIVKECPKAKREYECEVPAGT